MSETTAPAPVISGRYLESLLAGQPQLEASPLAWLKALRAEAVERVGALRLPTTRDEEWRFTDISLLSKTSFASALSATDLEAVDVAPLYIEEASTRLVFVDGIYAPELSSPNAGSGTHSGVVVSNLTSAMAVHAAAIKPHLGRHAPFTRDAFAAQNTAFLHCARSGLARWAICWAMPPLSHCLR